MAESPFINGIYYDGILFDRFTMVRVRKTLERNSKLHEPLIDMHTGNDFTGSRRTDAVQYANHWAYVDSLWIGEGFSYVSRAHLSLCCSHRSFLRQYTQQQHAHDQRLLPDANAIMMIGLTRGQLATGNKRNAVWSVL